MLPQSQARRTTTWQVMSHINRRISSRPRATIRYPWTGVDLHNIESLLWHFRGTRRCHSTGCPRACWKRMQDDTYYFPVPAAMQLLMHRSVWPRLSGKHSRWSVICYLPVTKASPLFLLEAKKLNAALDPTRRLAKVGAKHDMYVSDAVMSVVFQRPLTPLEASTSQIGEGAGRP